MNTELGKEELIFLPDGVREQKRVASAEHLCQKLN